MFFLSTKKKNLKKYLTKNYYYYPIQFNNFVPQIQDGSVQSCTSNANPKPKRHTNLGLGGGYVENKVTPQNFNYLNKNHA